jgi:hypothetical protein
MYKTFFFFLSFTMLFSAQVVISSKWETYTNSNGSIDSTIGEVVINTVTNGSNFLTQRFHQTKWNFFGVEEYDFNVLITIYPNSTSDFLNISSENNESLSYEVYDGQGKLVLKNKLVGPTTQISVSNFASGYYS